MVSEMFKSPGNLSAALILIAKQKLSDSTALLAAAVLCRRLLYVPSCCLTGPSGTQGSTPISFSVKYRV